MTVKEFAITYAGQSVISTYSPTWRTGSERKGLGRVVGYTTSSIILQFPNNVGWPIEENPDVVFVVSKNSVTHGWKVSLRDVEEPAPIIPEKPYPHKCKKCLSPARKCGGIVLCSNLNCNTTRKKCMKFFNSFKFEAGKDRSDPIEIKCIKCKKATRINLITDYIECSSCHTCYLFPYKASCWYKINTQIYYRTIDGVWTI